MNGTDRPEPPSGAGQQLTVVVAVVSSAALGVSTVGGTCGSRAAPHVPVVPH